MITVETPLNPLVPHLAAMLREAIVTRTVYLEIRKSILWASWTFPLVCREARRLSDELGDTLRWLWLFEIHIHKQHKPYWERTKLYPEGMRACEGLPPWFDVREQAKLSVRLQESHEYTKHDLARQGNYDARCWYARYCAGLESPAGHRPSAGFIRDEIVWKRKRFLCGKSNEIVYTAEDLAVPLEVEQFVGFLRWFMNSAIPRDQNNVPFELFCGTPGCNRPACIRAPMTLEESDASHKNGSYWSLTRCGVTQLRYDVQHPKNMQWCSFACEQAATAEYDECVRCCTDEELNAPPQRARSRTTTDPNKVSAARLLTAALDRNALIARRLRARTKTPVQLRFYPMTPVNLEWYQESLIDALNLDVGILFAAVHIASWAPSQRPARQLPNSADWRRCVFAYMNAICNVRRVYVDHADRKRDFTIPRGVDELHTNPNTPPRWMLELKNVLSEIF